jgi:hypothetical protein
VKKLILLIFFGFVLKPNCSGQTSDTVVIGYVSFKNTGNVYVRFPSTEKISIGDTLSIVRSGVYTPCLIVLAKSSISCVTTPVNNCEAILESQVVFRLHVSKKSKPIPVPIEPSKPKDTLSLKSKRPTFDPIKDKDPKTIGGKKNITGRLTTAYYGTFSDIDKSSRHSLTGRLSLNVDHISNSNWSFETYLNYRQNILDKPVPEGYQTKFFRIYNMAMNYDSIKNFKFAIGRKINNRMASVGAIDGIQSEFKMGRFFTGALIGFRPDIFNYNFNSKLLQLGFYGGHYQSRAKMYLETTLGIMEQRNGAATDRRYAYFQHTNRLNDKISMFSSVELDLFQNVSGKASIRPRLTSLYYSFNLQAGRKLSMMASYDSRRNIIYYESFIGNEIDRILAEDLNRQGFRIRINYKLSKRIYSGLSFGKRFQDDGNNNSDNIYGFITHSKLPWIGGNLNFNANFNRSNYLESKILAMRYDRDIFKQKINFSSYYRIVDYTYLKNDISQAYQHYIGSDLSFRLGKNSMFHIMGEWSIRGIENNYRMNFSLTKRIR